MGALGDSPLGDDGMPAAIGKHDDAEFDITAMIDLVFMMNIYFLVTFITAAMGGLELPTANHCFALDPETAVTITVAPGLDPQSVLVSIDGAADATPITNAAQQEERIAEAVAAGAQAGKKAVLIRAEKTIRLREMGRLAVAARHEGITLHLAVMEKDTAP